MNLSAVVRAFCGGLPRDIFGNLPPKGSPVDAYVSLTQVRGFIRRRLTKFFSSQTVPVVALVHGAKIVGPPVVGSASTTVPPKSQSSKAPLSVSTVSKAPASVSTLPSHSTLSKSHHHKSHTASRSALSANPTPTHHKVHPHKPHHPKSIHKAHKRLVYSHFGLCHKWKKQCEEYVPSSPLFNFCCASLTLLDLRKGSASKSVHSYCETHLLDFRTSPFLSHSSESIAHQVTISCDEGLLLFSRPRSHEGGHQGAVFEGGLRDRGLGTYTEDVESFRNARVLGLFTLVIHEEVGTREVQMERRECDMQGRDREWNVAEEEVRNLLSIEQLCISPSLHRSLPLSRIITSYDVVTAHL